MSSTYKPETLLLSVVTCRECCVFIMYSGFHSIMTQLDLVCLAYWFNLKFSHICRVLATQCILIRLKLWMMRWLRLTCLTCYLKKRSPIFQTRYLQNLWQSWLVWTRRTALSVMRPYASAVLGHIILTTWVSMSSKRLACATISYMVSGTRGRGWHYPVGVEIVVQRSWGDIRDYVLWIC